ncbi:MAG: hypothetical protein NC388_01940 [Clostridium sp.]|nr:hypothetical protein [Clostridium sp.]
MKRNLLTLLMTLFTVAGLNAMSYDEARDQARYLTDKMAYELNLNDAQYNDAYEINLDYLMSLRTADDVYGTALTYRNADLRSILYDWQYTLFSAASYFFHPVYWRAGVWHYPIYTRYTPGFFYYSTPRVFVTYRGGHGRAHYARVSYYNNRRPVWTSGLRGEHRGPVEHRGPGVATRPGRPSSPVKPQKPQRPGRPGNSIRPDASRPNRPGYGGGNNGFHTGSASQSERGTNRQIRPDRTRPGRGDGSRPALTAKPVSSSNRPIAGNGVSGRPSRTYGSSSTNSAHVRHSSSGSTGSATVRHTRSSSISSRNVSASRGSISSHNNSSYQRQSSTRTTVRQHR